MVRPGARTTFRRSIRNAKGGIVRKLEFPPGTPVDLTSRQELEAIYNDIGKALVIVERNDMGQAKPDWDATGEVVRERDGRPAGGDAEEVDGEEPEGIVIDLEIDEDLVELLKRHQAELPSPVTVESLADWVKEGNSFTTLDGFTVDSVSRLHQALALDRMSKRKATTAVLIC